MTTSPCMNCGYSLSGHGDPGKEVACPECGFVQRLHESLDGYIPTSRSMIRGFLAGATQVGAAAVCAVLLRAFTGESHSLILTGVGALCVATAPIVGSWVAVRCIDQTSRRSGMGPISRARLAGLFCSSAVMFGALYLLTGAFCIFMTS